MGNGTIGVFRFGFISRAIFLRKIGGVATPFKKSFPTRPSIVDKMTPTSRKDRSAACSTLHAAQYPCVFFKRNAVFPAFYVIQITAKVTTDHLCELIESMQSTAPPLSILQSILQSKVENT